MKNKMTVTGVIKAVLKKRYLDSKKSLKNLKGFEKAQKMADLLPLSKMIDMSDDYIDNKLKDFAVKNGYAKNGIIQVKNVAMVYKFYDYLKNEYMQTDEYKKDRIAAMMLQHNGYVYDDISNEFRFDNFDENYPQYILDILDANNVKNDQDKFIAEHILVKNKKGELLTVKYSELTKTK